MTTVVISQPMLFPWVGMFEQIRLADVYVHYDDVPFSKGSFSNRVQLKSAEGPVWMTIPLEGHHLGQRICDLQPSRSQPWRDRHLQLLQRHYAAAPFRDEMLALVEDVYAARGLSLCETIMESMTRIVRYFALCPEQRVLVASRDLKIDGKGSERVLAIVQALGGTTYVTGHGASRYLAHERFEQAGISVAYLNYQKHPYHQLHGAFTPFVSVLDLIANVGPAGRALIASPAIDWKEFLSHA